MFVDYRDQDFICSRFQTMVLFMIQESRPWLSSIFKTIALSNIPDLGSLHESRPWFSSKIPWLSSKSSSFSFISAFLDSNFSTLKNNVFMLCMLKRSWFQPYLVWRVSQMGSQKVLWHCRKVKREYCRRYLLKFIFCTKSVLQYGFYFYLFIFFISLLKAQYA